jgi:peroxiredoxin (alkyl hydroperoxide reductase subunit C)
MSLKLGETAPDFTAPSTKGELKLHDYVGSSWLVFFSHPADFTPVCTTELGEFAKRKGEFDQRNVKLIGLSVDPLESHQGWAPDIADVKGTPLNFPLVADPDRKVAELYDMIHPSMNEKVTVRSVFVIGPDKKVKLIITYPQTTGRNIDEILRVVDSLQLTANYSVSTPVDWKSGDEVIIAGSVSDEAAKDKFPEGFRAEKPYLRWVKQPTGK